MREDLIRKIYGRRFFSCCLYLDMKNFYLRNIKHIGILSFPSSHHLRIEIKRFLAVLVSSILNHSMRAVCFSDLCISIVSSG